MRDVHGLIHECSFYCMKKAAFGRFSAFIQPEPGSMVGRDQLPLVINVSHRKRILLRPEPWLVIVIKAKGTPVLVDDGIDAAFALEKNKCRGRTSSGRYHLHAHLGLVVMERTISSRAHELLALAAVCPH